MSANVCQAPILDFKEGADEVTNVSRLLQQSLNFVNIMAANFIKYSFIFFDKTKEYAI